MAITRRILPVVPVQGTGQVAPPAAVVDRLNTLPLRGVQDVAGRFPGVPVEVVRAETHFTNLRIVTTSTCRMRCGFPGEDTLWCHNEGLARGQVPDADYQRVLTTVAYFRDRYDIRQVTLAGLQPRLDDNLLAFIEALRAAGVEQVSMVSHGLRLLDWLDRLHAAGLSDLVLSVQAFTRAAYADIMGVDAFDNALKVIDLARHIGLPVTLNRVIQRGSHNDIPGFLQWARERDLRVRLYDVLWMPGQGELFLRHHISWQEITDLWADHTERITVWQFDLPGRTNLVFHLTGGGSIETNINVPRLQHTAPVCQSCAVRDACAEGWLGCGIRVTPDQQVQACVLRPDLAMPLTGPDGRYVEGSTLDAYLSGTPPTAD